MKHTSPATALIGATALVMPAVRPRGLIGPTLRADANDPVALIKALGESVHALRTDLDKKATKEDVVDKERVERIDASIAGFQASLDELSAKLQALAKAAPTDPILGDLAATPKEYVDAFKAHMRKGTEIPDEVVKAAMTKGSDADGGLLAPIEWDRTIIDKLKQISPIRDNARVQSITSAGFKKLFNDRNVGSGWVGETASRPATSTPQLGVLDFTTGELYANPAISQQLLDDAAINLEEWLGSEVRTEFARQEGIAFLSGDGSNKPYGILTFVTGAANAARHPWGAIGVVNSGDTNLMTGDGFINLMYALPGEFAGNAKLYINRTSLGAVRKMKDGQGNYLWQPSFQLGQPQTINGAPVVEIPGMPAVAAGNIAALYGDMEATYLVIDRLGIRVLRDPYTNKPYVHFYTVKRVGGGVYNPEPMRALKIGA